MHTPVPPHTLMVSQAQFWSFSIIYFSELCLTKWKPVHSSYIVVTLTCNQVQLCLIHVNHLSATEYKTMERYINGAISKVIVAAGALLSVGWGRILMCFLSFQKNAVSQRKTKLMEVTQNTHRDRTQVRIITCCLLLQPASSPSTANNRPCPRCHSLYSLFDLTCMGCLCAEEKKEGWHLPCIDYQGLNQGTIMFVFISIEPRRPLT